MNASEARQLAMIAKNNQDDEEQKAFAEIVGQVADFIAKSAGAGFNKVTIDLKSPNINSRINKMLDRVKTHFQQDGFTVDYKLVRTPNGAREMIVEW